MPSCVFHAQQAVGPRIFAPALVTPVPFSARYDLDRQSGIISRADHPLRGENLAGRVLVSKGVQGGVAAGWALLSLESRGLGFAGLVFGDTNPVMVQGAIAASIPIFAGLGDDFFITVQTGDLLILDPATRTVTIQETNEEALSSHRSPERLAT